MVTPLRKDWFMTGFIAGTTGAVIKTMTNLLLEKKGIETSRFTSAASSFVIGRKTADGTISIGRLTKPQEALGYFADAFTGGIMGVITAYIIAKTPPGNDFLKGSIMGTTSGGLSLILGKVFRIGRLNSMKPAQSMTMLGMATFFGGIQGLFLAKLAGQQIQQSHPVLVKSVTDKEFHEGLADGETLKNPDKDYIPQIDETT